MDLTTLLVVLALGTLLAGVVFALASKAQVEARMDDPSATKSTLAKDKSSTGKPADV